MKTRIEETTIFVFTTLLIGRVLAPFLMLAQCSVLARPDLYNLFTYIR